MPLPRHAGAYPVEREILDIAITRNERLEYELATPGAAIHFRQRLNRLRQLLRAEGNNKYNRLTFGLDGKKVILDFVRPSGFLRTETGEEIPLVVAPTKLEAETSSLVRVAEEWTEGLDPTIFEEEK